MTREEAIAVLAESKRQNEVMRDNPSTFWASHQMADGIKNTKRRIDALDVALSALRPVDREKWEPCEWCGSVGKTPDNWVCTLEDDNGHTVTNNHMVVCAPVNYCPVCGRPLTPEAWEEMESRING